MGFNCELCGKNYKLEKWYKKHQETVHANHGNPNPDEVAGPSTSTSNNHRDDGGDEDDDEDLTAEISAVQMLDWGDWSGGEDEDDEVESYCHLVLDPWLEEEEEEMRREARAGLTETESSSSNAQKKKKTPIVKCKDCKTVFSTLEGYVKHRIGHGMQAAMLRLPQMVEIMKNCPSLGIATCCEMQDTKLTQGLAQTTALLAEEMKQYCDLEVLTSFYKILCERLLSFLQERSDFIFPSAFACAFLINCSAAVVDKDFRTTLICNLTDVIVLSPAVSNIFLTNFIMKFSNKLLAYLLRAIGKDVSSEFKSLESRYAVTYQSVRSLDFKQNMHYIGGSNVKSILKTALQVKHRNEEWDRLISTIKKHFIVSEFASAPEPELMAWTESLDRGKLTKISNKALEFFVQLGMEVKPLERLDGSLLNDEVLDKVSNSPNLLLRWDELKGNLSEKESFKLLHAITLQFCITWRNGIIGRRHDEMAVAKQAKKFGTGGISFRASLGGK